MVKLNMSQGVNSTEILDIKHISELSLTEINALIITNETKITKLDLRCQCFFSINKEFLLEILQIPQLSIDTVDLSLNFNFNDSINNLHQLIHFFPESIHTIELSIYDFLSPQEYLVYYYNPHPFSTSALINKFLAEKKGQVVELLLNLPAHIKTILIDKQYTIDVFKTVMQSLLADEILKKFINGDFLPCDIRDENKDNLISPAHPIDHNRFQKIIYFIQNRPFALGYLIAAFLYDGAIDSQNIQANQTQRLFKAFSFYRKAAHDSSLKPIIEFLLWHKRTVYQQQEDSLITYELNQYQLTPEYLMPCFKFFKEGHSKCMLPPIDIKRDKFDNFKR